MAKLSKQIEKLFRAKRKRRQALARLPVEEKVKILVQLQEIAMPIFLARGLKKRLWKI